MFMQWLGRDDIVNLGIFMFSGYLVNLEISCLVGMVNLSKVMNNRWMVLGITLEDIYFKIQVIN